MAKAKVSIFDNKILTSIALYFGGNFGPASWEAVANLRCFVTIWLFENCHYQSELNKEALALLSFPPITHTAMRKHRCRVHPPQNDLAIAITEFKLFYRMFVDDAVTAAPRKIINMQDIAASSMEGAYLLMGYPGPIQKPILPLVMADDKIRNRKIGTKQVNLGTKFVTKRLLITIEDYKIECLKFILKET